MEISTKTSNLLWYWHQPDLDWSKQLQPRFIFENGW